MPRLKQAPDWVDYIIQPGDTLSHIAIRQNTRVVDLMAHNPQITNPDLIYAGHTMQIPLSDAKDIRGAIGIVRNLHGYSEDQYIAAAQMLAETIISNGKPEVSPTSSIPALSYEEAFYEMAKVLGIGARTSSPREVFEEEMLPKLKKAVAVLEGQVPMQFLYENHRGERNVRHVLPIRTYYGTTEHYPQPCYLLEALDTDRGAVRTFSMAHIVMHLGR